MKTENWSKKVSWNIFDWRWTESTTGAKRLPHNSEPFAKQRCEFVFHIYQPNPQRFMVTKTYEWTPTNFAKSKESIANSHSIEFFNFNECVQVSKASLFTISPLGEHHYSPAKSFRLWVLRLRAQPQEPCGQRGAHSSNWRWPSGSSQSSSSCVT